MDTPRIEKRIGVRASADALWDLVADMSFWSRWNLVEIDPQGTIAFGGEIRATERFPDLPERPIVGRVTEWQPRAQLVWHEKRGFLFNSTRYFEIEELEAGSCIASTGIMFSGLRGEMYFDKHRAKLGRGLQSIVESWKAAAEAA